MTFVVNHTDCLVYLKTVADNTFDSVVTDPPYGLGFMGKNWDKALPDKEIWNECLRVLKPGGHMVVFGAPRIYHRLTCQIEDAGFEVRDCLMWLFGSGFPKSLDVNKAIENSESAEWQGWGTALKPAYEPILLVRKPLEGTVASNVLKWGTGGLNIDGCRVETTESLSGGAYAKTSTERHDGNDSWRFKPGQAGEYIQPSGRWPANVILDEEAGKTLDKQTGVLYSGASKEWKGNQEHESAALGKKRPMLKPREKDSGGASRFFYCAKTSKSERELGLEDQESKTVKDGRKAKADNPRLRGETERKNTHPTVKPISLMSWLVRLVTPQGGTVLDPFTGSGSTGCATVQEGFNFVGCELEEEYVNIAKLRIGASDQD